MENIISSVIEGIVWWWVCLILNRATAAELDGGLTATELKFSLWLVSLPRGAALPHIFALLGDPAYATPFLVKALCHFLLKQPGLSASIDAGIEAWFVDGSVQRAFSVRTNRQSDAAASGMLDLLKDRQFEPVKEEGILRRCLLGSSAKAITFAAAKRVAELTNVGGELPPELLRVIIALALGDELERGFEG